MALAYAFNIKEVILISFVEIEKLFGKKLFMRLAVTERTEFDEEMNRSGYEAITSWPAPAPLRAWSPSWWRCVARAAHSYHTLQQCK